MWIKWGYYILYVVPELWSVVYRKYFWFACCMYCFNCVWGGEAGHWCSSMVVGCVGG